MSCQCSLVDADRNLTYSTDGWGGGGCGGGKGWSFLVLNTACWHDRGTNYKVSCEQNLLLKPKQ